MPLDALFLTALRAELAEKLIGCRVDKVQQPSRDTLLLQLRAPGAQGRLLLSASPNHPRVHLTQAAFENPAQPPMFCMLLRKHLTGGRLLEITQPPMERLVQLRFACTGELGESSEKTLVLELMGRNSNLILCGEDGRIIDCMRRVDFEMSEQRQVLPGLFYRLPPAQGKRDAMQTDLDALRALLAAVTEPKTFDSWLLETFGGISPLVCRELAFRLTESVDTDLAALDAAQREALSGKLYDLLRALQSVPPQPVLILQDGAPKDFTCLPVTQYGALRECRVLPSFSELLDGFYSERDRAERIRGKTQALRKSLTTLHSRAVRKLQTQRMELEKTKDREHLRRMGDIVTANLHAIARGQAFVDATDFYDPEMKTVRIALDPAISPQQNAAKFYKSYQKAKTAERVLTGQIAAGEQEAAYLASVLDALSRAESERDVQEIRAELLAGRYLREQRGKKQQKLPPSRPMEFLSSDGYTILVGRNNVQNDQLTLKTAAKTDFWLHAQKIPGSHVIILAGGTTPPDETFTEAAMLAAQYSGAQNGQNIPVDCTEVRIVKKPNGAKPGMVVYDRYRTLYITPDPARIEQLRVR